MKKIIAATVLLFVLVTSGIAFSQDSKNAEKKLKETFPNFTIDSFKESEIKGFYEITAGDQIFYFSPDGYMVFGEIWSKDGKSITSEKKQQLMRKKIQNLSFEKAVKIGNGKNTVIEISDPDCSFCRRASDFFAKRSDVTRYVFLFPLKQIHPDAERKSKYILCSSDRAKAYEEVYAGNLDGKNLEIMPACEPDVTKTLNDHIKAVQSLGVNGTPAFWINGKHVEGANILLIEKLLSGGND